MEVDLKRFEALYQELVDETENPTTYRSKDRSELLTKLLVLMEYLRGMDEKNPLEDWFRA